MNPPVLELSGLSKTFRPRDAIPLRAVDDVSLHIDRGECVALVGESGSGKSTLARLALRLITPDSGTVTLQGRSLMQLSPPALRAARLAMQPIFQDPAASFNPRRTVRAILAQVLVQAGATSVADEQLDTLLARVELRPARDYLGRYPHELSGGQRQRLAIARAIAAQPAVIIADEPLSGADVSIRAQILNLLVDLQRDCGVAYLLITHDMLVARAFSHRVAVMYRGRVIEEGATDEVLAAPRHPYTKSLIAAVQSLDPPYAHDGPAPEGNGSANRVQRGDATPGPGASHFTLDR
jgi:ABC-type glutathione transport system ATPase component